MKFIASGIYKTINCPGSLNQEEITPDELKYSRFGDAATLGKIIHSMCEETIKPIADGKKPPTAAALCKKYKITDPFEKEKAKNCIKVYSQWFKKELKKHDSPVVEIEGKYRHFDNEGNEFVFKADVLIYSKDRLTIGDLKTGNFDYSKSAFEQLFFSGNVFCSLKNVLFENYNFAIIQPNFWKDDLKVFEYNAEAMEEHYFNKLIQSTKEAKLCTGDWCMFCGGKLTCPAVRNLTDIVHTLAMAEELESVNFDTLQEIYNSKSVIESYLKDVEGLLTTAMKEEGKTFEKVMLEPINTRRKWKNEKEVEKKLKKKLGDKIYKKTLLSPTQLEKLTDKKDLEDLYYKPEGWKIAKRESDFGDI